MSRPEATRQGPGYRAYLLDLPIVYEHEHIRAAIQALVDEIASVLTTIEKLFLGLGGRERTMVPAG